MSLVNLRQFIEILRREKEIVDIYEEVDPHLEIAEIHRRVIAQAGPALFFHHVKNSSFPVVTNLFGTLKRVLLAFPHHPDKMVEDLVALIKKEPSLPLLWERRSLLKKLVKIGTKKRGFGAVREVDMGVDLEKLPLLTSWPLDGGPFITLPLVYTEAPGGKSPPNLGMYRIQRYDKRTTGLHFQIGKGGGFHYHEAEKANLPLPVNIFIGGPPALMMSAIAPLPENLSELLIASLLQGSKLSLCKSPHNHYPLISECEFALVGSAAPHQRRPEGPFGDHYGYYSWIHDFPVFNCEAIYHRKGAIYPATIVGKPYQEDFFLGEYLQKLLSPLFPMVMPGVKSLHSYGETGFHSLGAAVVKERFYRECMQSAFRILGEGQLALTKFLLLTDQEVSLPNFKKTLSTILERFQPETDLFIFSNLSLDTLDYTGPELNKGSRGVMLGTGEKRRDLPQTFHAPLPQGITQALPFCPGCLVLEGQMQGKVQDRVPDLAAIYSHPPFAPWPLLILVDDLKKTLESEVNFLWTTFTRFEPAADIHAKVAKVHRHHLVYEGPILIDARMKHTYLPEVEVDEKTSAQVTKRWDSLFPGKLLGVHGS